MKQRILGKTMVLTVLAGAGFLAACTKTVPYDVVYKEKVHSKSEIDTNAEYLYVASSDIASADDLGAAMARPYMQGQESIVKFRFTETSLRIVEVNEEERLKSNSLNEKVLLEIPVKHIEYRCAEDRYGKCTNREEENTEKPWNRKANFIPDFENVKSPGLSLLPVESNKLWGENCYQETSARFMNYEIKPDSFNFQVEKTFTGTLECLRGSGGSFNNFSQLQTQIVFHYSFAKLSKISSANYEPVSYPRKTDEGAFGFFSTQYRKYDVDYVRREKNRKDMMNRWNPKRKEIVYHFSDNFQKPEFAPLKKASHLAFERINAGLKEAGVDLRLTLKDGKGHAPGDIRNSMIILVEDPIAGGPLGYGPSVANPRTGEIVSARTVMYWGNLLQGVSMTYDELVREMRRERAKAKEAAKASSKPAAQNGGGDSSSRIGLAAELQREQWMKTSVAARLSKKISSAAARDYTRTRLGTQARNASRVSVRDQVSARSLETMTEKDFMKMSLQVSHKADPEDRIAAMSNGHCMYPSELFPFDEALARALDSKLQGDLRPWEDLSDSEKNEIIALVAPEIWIPTLVHEIGHNLGLRHNFGGSEDKANFYTPAELAKWNVKHVVPYSSVMDYGASELNLLPTLGKYDIAAFRYAYARKVEKEDGSLVEVKTSLADLQAADPSLKLKDYQYCTDEHVSVNPNCQRFDEGTSRVEILQSMIRKYEDYYSMRNNRNGRENFSEMSDRAYYGARYANFSSIRAFMESYESIKYRFKIPDDSPMWKEGFLKDVKDAALMSADFFVKVLKTPDIICAISKKENPEQIVLLAPIDQFDANGVDCFLDVQLKPEYVVVGQAGKSFSNRKSPRSNNTYADQIDVRGIWTDKVVAAKMLFARQTGNSIFDRNEDNYTDIPEVAEKVVSSVTDMVLNSVKTDLTFRDREGVEFTIPNVAVQVFSTPESLKAEDEVATHWLEVPMDEAFGKRLGIERQMTFQELLLKIVNKSMTGSQSHWNEGRDFMDKFRVIKTSKAYQLNEETRKSAVVKDIAGMRVVAMPENLLGREAATISHVSELLGKLSPEQLDQLVESRKKAVTPAAAQNNGTQVQQAVWSGPSIYNEIPLELIEAYKGKKLPDGKMLEYLLSILPATNEAVN